MKLFARLLGAFRPRRKKRETPLEPQGNCYNLQDIYDQLNQHYFAGTLKLTITWSGSAARSARRCRRLGLYSFRTQKIKIHRLLDQEHFPSYFISFVVYHEMLHSAVPPVKGARGRRQIHHRNFKVREREFEHYAKVKNWEKENRQLLFNSG